MTSLRRFWTQPSTHYRNFQIVFTLLALNFAIPTLQYVIAPEAAMDAFASLNAWLGGAAWEFPESESRFWRYLGTANVAALAFMCVWMLRDLRHRYATVWPLTFLKGTAATLWIAGYLAAPEYPAMLAAGIFDALTCVAFVVFATLAYADTHGMPHQHLVPRPVGVSPLGWSQLEHRWMRSILDATLPADPDGRLPGVGEVDLEDFWPEYRQNVPLQFRLGLRAATWAITLWPILTFKSIRPFHRLSDDAKDDVLRSIEDSRFFVVRQLTFVMKTTAGFAYFRDGGIKAKFPTAYPDSDAIVEPTDSPFDTHPN